LGVRSLDLVCRQGPSYRCRHHPSCHLLCGGSRNFHKFLDLFDKVFVLDIDVETLNRRLDGRPNEPGFEPGERALVLHYHRTREYLPAGIHIDMANTVLSVVDDILTKLTGRLSS
jgi:thymidylate kinase